jgi:hypothetical protein
MNIIIKDIPHKEQRYPTCGDWWFENGELHIRVSKELPAPCRMLIALHELAEVMMCMANGVTQEDVDKFDMDYEKNRQPGDESEPGDSVNAPYWKEHGYATAIERIVATQMGWPWNEHEKEINGLFDETD